MPCAEDDGRKLDHTPVVRGTGARHSLNMVSTVTAQALLRFSTYTGPFTAKLSIESCKKIRADTDGDGLPDRQRRSYLKAKAVKTFLHGGRLKLFVQFELWARQQSVTCRTALVN